MTRQELVCDYLYHFRKRGITQLDAYQFRWQGKPCPVTRLSAVIYDLRELGFIIESRRETGKDIFGRHCSWTRYFLKEHPNCKDCHHSEIVFGEWRCDERMRNLYDTGFAACGAYKEDRKPWDYEILRREEWRTTSAI